MTPEQKQRLQNQGRSLSAEGLELLNRCIIGNRDFTDDERKRYEKVNADMVDVEKQLTGASPGGSVQDVHGRLSQFAAPADAAMMDAGETHGESRAIELHSKKWSELRQVCGGSAHAGEWRSPDEYLQAVASGRHHPELHFAGQNTGVGDLGGFAVPDEMAAGIMDMSLESEIVRPRARGWGMRSRTLSVPQWQNLDHSDGTLYGGVTISWAQETGELDVATAKLQQLKFEAKKCSFLGRVSSELAEDSPSFAEEFQQALRNAVGFGLDRAFLKGVGTSEPMGILNAACTLEIAPEGGQAAATIVYDNLVKMFSRALRPSQGVWVVSTSALPQLLTLTIATGTGGSHIPVLREGANGMTLLTRPVITTEKLPVLGSRGDILFADFPFYGIGMRAELSLMISPHVKFTSDELMFRLRTRLDGKPVLSGPVTLEDGVTTVSPFVVLGARS